jgi:flagellin-like protein
MKKGLSPVIGSVLLIVITITLGIIIFSWSNSFVKNLSPPIDCSEVSFKAGVFTNTDSRGNTVNVLEIDNTGNRDISGFLIENKDTTSDSTNIIEIDIPVLTGKSETININFEPKDEVFVIPKIIKSDNEFTCPDSSGVFA